MCDQFQLNEGVNMFQRQFVSELRRCEEMERQLSNYFVFSVCCWKEL